jgi:hypothetical protein
MLKSLAVTGALLGAALTVAPATAMPLAAPLGAAPLGAAMADAGAPLVNVQYYGHRHRHHHHHRHHRRNDVGGAIAAGAALGIIGGIMAAQAQPRYYEPAPVYVEPRGDVHAYCFSKFKSYDPESGTYLGYDGYRHPCP